MTEDQIERRVELEMNRLDARLMGGRLSQAEYDREVVILDKWASQQYRPCDCRYCRECLARRFGKGE